MQDNNNNNKFYNNNNNICNNIIHVRWLYLNLFYSLWPSVIE